jgi:hypothetical protein
MQHPGTSKQTRAGFPRQRIQNDSRRRELFGKNDPTTLVKNLRMKYVML